MALGDLSYHPQAVWHRRRAAASVGAGALVCESGIEKEEGDGERESHLFLNLSG